MADQTMKDKIQSIIDEEKRNKTGVLDFDTCRLKVWPREIFDMTWLKVLRIKGGFRELSNDVGVKNVLNFDISNIPKEMQLLTQLEELHLESLGIFLIRHLDYCTDLKTLNLKDNRVRSIVNVSILKQLETLDLSYNRISAMGNQLKSLTSLKTLILNDNKIIKIRGLERLIHLQRLNLDSNSIETIENLDALINLQTLLLKDNKLGLIQGLDKLIRLKSLNLARNRIKRIENLDSLVVLEKLQLTNNNISVIQNIEHLTNLKELYLGTNEIEKLINLDHLKNLVILELGENEISKIENLDKLPNLTRLSLYSNKITKIENLGKQRKLNELSLSNNGIENIESLDKLVSLKKLFISDNKIEVVRLQLLEKLEFINITRNPLLDIPVEDLSEKGKDIVKLTRFLKDFQEKNLLKIPLPVKIIVLGNSEDGKTSLCKYLISDKNQFTSTDNLSTHGLQIRTWKEKLGDYKVDALIYDFGGQDYYHATYNMFFSQHALYVLLWNADRRKNQYMKSSFRDLKDENFMPYIAYLPSYWLDNINYYLKRINGKYKGAKKEIDVQTNDEKTIHEEHLEKNNVSDINKDNVYLMTINNIQINSQNKNLIQDEFLNVDELPFKIDCQYNLSLIEDKKMTNQVKGAALKAEFAEYVNALSRKYPVHKDDAYFVKRIIKKVRKGNNTYQRKKVDTFISKTRYKDDDYLKVLHKMGMVLYYHDHKKLQTYFWEDPSTVSQEIYKNLSQQCFNEFNGKIKFAFFEDKIDRGLIDLMLAQEIVFKDEHTGHYVVPQFLESTQNDPLYALAKIRIENGFYLRFKRFLPHGLMSRLICRFGVNPGKKHYFRYEVICSFALNEGDNLNQQIKLSISLDPINLLLRINFSVPEQLMKYKYSIKRYLFLSILAAYYNQKHLTYQHWKQVVPMHKERLTELESKRKKDETVWNSPKLEFLVPKDLNISLNDQDYVHYRFLCEKNDQRIVEAQHIETQVNSFLKRSLFNPFVSQSNKIKAIKSVFISYSHEDMKYKKRLMSFLTNLERKHQIEVWHDGELVPGTEWDKSIKNQIGKADIVILLISQDFIASSYIHEVEMKKSFEQLQGGTSRIIPVLLRPCDWKGYPIISLNNTDRETENNQQLSNYQLIPQDANNLLKPINKWEDQDEAWQQVIEVINAISG